MEELKCPICGEATRVYKMLEKIDCVLNMQMN